MAKGRVEHPTFAPAFHPGEGEIVIFAVNPLHAHVGSGWVQREQHPQLGPVVRRPILVNLIGQSEFLSLKCRHEGILRRFDRDPDLLIPRMSDDVAPTNSLNSGQCALAATA